MNRYICPNCTKPYQAGAYYCSKCGLSFTMRQMAIGSHLQPGQVLDGRYTIIRLLGKGQMGAVYLASQSITNQQRHVVVKEMLHYFDAHDPEAQAKNQTRQLFEAEAATLVSLNVAGVPRIIDYFSENKRYYIVMEYIQGHTLEKGLTRHDEQGTLIAGRPYSVEDVRRWGVELCKVLEKLAARNIVHLDIKPANLILDHSKHLWLVDFGTARTRWMSLPRGKLGLYNSGIAGTTGYAPPEQYQNKIEPRSDVYALAATLYHLLTDDDPRENPFHFPKLPLSHAANGLPSLEQTIKAALKHALQENVAKRLSARELRELLEIRPESEPIFIWQDGTISKNPKALGLTAMSIPDKSKWEEARTYFMNGSWERWFKAIDDPQAWLQMNKATMQHQNPDLALDCFLRALEPGLPPPVLQLHLSWLDFGVVPWQDKHTQTLELHNRGAGALSAQLTNLPAWMKVRPLEFGTHDRQSMQITVDTSELTPRAQPYSVDLVIDSGLGGKKEVEVTMLVPEPRLEIKPSHLKLELNDQRDALSGTLTVRNPGGSPFDGRIEWNGAWLTVEPVNFRCAPNDSSEITIKAPIDQIGLKQYVSKLTVQGQAAEWNHSEEAQVYVPSLLFRFDGGLAGFLRGMMIGIPLSLVAHWVVSQMILPQLNDFTSAMILLGENSFNALQSQQTNVLIWGALMGALGGGWGTSRFTDRNWWSRYLKVGAYGGAFSLLVIWLVLMFQMKGSAIFMRSDFSQFVWSGVMIASSLMVIGGVMGTIWGGVVAVIRWILSRVFNLILS